MHFNSIKVRLEHSCGNIKKCLQLFQFHKGTIRTIIGFSYVYEAPTFQFHKGTIRTEKKKHHLSYLNTFQFHKGTIRTYNL